MVTSHRVYRYFSILNWLLIALLAGCNFPGKQVVAPSNLEPAAPPVAQNNQPAAGENQAVSTATSEAVPLAGNPAAATKIPGATPAPIVTPLPDIKPDNDFLKFVPAGPFKMGSTSDDLVALKDEFPQHNLDISPFWIYKAEVTNQMYAECVKAGKCASPKVGPNPPSSHYTDPNFAKWPVVGVDWYNAEAYCEFADARLPTEAEWEKTARGTQVRLFPWGNDAPTCDLLNMKDCIKNPPDTQKINNYPVGRSQYKVVDMSGNVREWVHDWYLEDYYLKSPGWDPQGPPDGKMKVIRGGSFIDPTQNVRTTGRFSALPKDTFEDVGFRCIPVGQPAGGSAPFCKASYKPFCNKPGIKPCTPVVVKTLGKPTVDYGCPNGDVSTIMIASGFASADGASVTINGVPYDCHTEPGYPGRLLCTGAPLPGNSYGSVEICVNGDTPIAQSQSALLPVTVEIPPVNTSGGKALFSPTMEDFLVTVHPGGGGGSLCPDGWQPNSDGECVPVPKDLCPDGWIWNNKIAHCMPVSKNSCPKGSTPVGVGDYVFCTPVNNQCPNGYHTSSLAAPLQTIAAVAPIKYCYPFKEDGPCQQGYRFNTSTNCCESIPKDNLGCEPGKFYRSLVYNRCIPIKGDGCSYGQHFVYGKGCLDDYNPETGEPALAMATDLAPHNPPPACPFGLVDDGNGNCILPLKDCVAPMIKDDKGGCSFPDQFTAAAFDYTSEIKCLPGNTLVDGTCVPDKDLQGKIDCGSGVTYLAAMGVCANNDENNCPPGTYKDPVSGKCVPRTGTGSRCAYGYIYNPQTKCCDPIPGTQGSACPRPKLVDTILPPPSADATNLGAPPIMGDGGAVGLFSQEFLSIDTNFDPLSGFCYPDAGQPCPPGYIPKGKACVLPQWNPNDCPAGTIPDEVNKVCIPTATAVCPTGLASDTSNNSCLLTMQMDCPIDTVAQNGNCYPLEGKGCPDGTTEDKDLAGALVCIPTKEKIPTCDEKTLYLDAVVGICVPRTPGCCRPGYSYDKAKNLCIPIKLTIAPPDGKECPFGSQWNTDKLQCLPVSMDGSGENCVTLRFSVPECNGPCLAPLEWNGKQCIKPGPPPTVPGKKPNPCTQWGSDSLCKRHGCSWQNNSCG